MQYLNKFKDDRGVLVPIEFFDLPFLPKRVFYVNHVPIGTWRGGHAHRRTEQLLVCVQGKIAVKLESNTGVTEMVLEEGQSCFVDKMVWDSQKFITKNSVLLVFCSTNYDDSDYIFDKSEIF